MSDAKDKAYKKLERTLFLSREEASLELTALQLERKQRIMLCVARKLEDPLLSDKRLADELAEGFGGSLRPVTRATAYRDIAAVSRLLGNIQLAAKAWYRYTIVEGAKEAYRIAKEEKDARGMAAALDKLGKYTRADRQDDAFDWERLIPPSFEPSADVSLLGDGTEKIENLEERRRQLRQLFQKGKHVQDAVIVHDENQ